MSTPLASSLRNERWELGDQAWSRNPTTGSFDLADYRGFDAAPGICDPLDLAALVGARVSLDEADRCGRPVALYPRSFKFSPVTGKALPEPSIGPPDPWLPPFGGGDSAAEEPQGLRLTAVRLALRQTLNAESLPDRQLPLPPTGNCQFLVGAFGTCESRLLALERSRGLIYCWLPHSESWVEIRPRGATLAESSLAEHAWGMAAEDPRRSCTIFLPTDDGLAVVSLNLIARSYELHAIGQHCVGGPVMWQGKVYAPMQEEEAKIGVYVLDPQDAAMRRIDGPALEAAAVEWVRPLADRRQIIWMGSMGQLVVKRRDADDSLEASLLPWPPGLAPRWDLGSPYLSHSGHLWQQCVLQDEQGRQFVFVQLGTGEPAIRTASSPRLSTGMACFQLATRLRLAPWFDSDDFMDADDNEVIVPLLESTSASTVLCARIASERPVDELFASNDPCRATFELRGEHVVPFCVTRTPRPWATRAFVYAGHLYLHHPDKSRLPGWRIDP
jgi:hypothetical protein